MIAEDWWLTRSRGLAKRLMEVRKEQESGLEMPLSTFGERSYDTQLMCPAGLAKLNWKPKG